MPVPPDEMVYGSIEPEDTLTKDEADLLARLTSMDDWNEWLLFVNAGFKTEAARGLKDRGIIEVGSVMGMSAARLISKAERPPNRSRMKCARCPINVGCEWGCLRALT